LPADVKARLEALKMARDLGGVSTFDIIRATQELEIARGDVTAEEYASLIAEEEMGTAASILGDADDLEDRIEDAAADLEAAEETIQDMIGRAPDEMRDDLEDLLEAVSDAAEVLTDPDPGEGPDDDEEGAE
jgi:outer membrane protein TolC